MSDELELLRRRLEREKQARRQAEQIAEENSRALYLKGQDLEKALLELERLSLTDPLTGLNNRRGFDIEAHRNMLLAIRHKRPLAALMLDIDFFKKVNDTYGHAAGDKVLVEVAHLCRQHIRGTDTLARFGGEEFCFLLPETDTEAAKALAERVCTDVSTLGFEFNGKSLSVTVSIGISAFSGEEDSLESLLERSDEALYCAKHAGRNRVVIWKAA